MSWRGDLNNVLIVSATNNQADRFIFESELERRVTAGGLRGEISLDALRNEVTYREAVEAFFANNNIDFVIATRLEGPMWKRLISRHRQ